MPDIFANSVQYQSGMVELLVGHRTCDSWIAGLIHAVVQWSIASYLHLCASVTNQYNLVPAKGSVPVAGEVTVGLAESNGSLLLGL